MSGLARERIKPWGLALLIALSVSGLALTNSAQALAAPVLQVSVTHKPARVPAGTYATYTITVSNSGDTETTTPVDIRVEAPSGMSVTSVAAEKYLGLFPLWSCALAPDSRIAECSGPEGLGTQLPIAAGKEACMGFPGIPCRIFATLKAEKTVTPGALAPSVEACGGGAASCALASDPTEIVPDRFQIESFDGSVLEQNGEPALRAGSHPFSASLSYSLNLAGTADGQVLPFGAQKDVTIDLPPGLIAAPDVAASCSAALFTSEAEGGCPDESQVGVASLHLVALSKSEPIDVEVPVYNLERPPGVAAQFGLAFAGAFAYIVGKIRTGDDYGISTVLENTPVIYPVRGLDLTLWGTPAAAALDPLRGECLESDAEDSCPSELPPKPMLTLPTSCAGPQRTEITISSWEMGMASASFLSHDDALPTPNQASATGCDALDFKPILQARPTSDIAGSQSGLGLDLHLPQSEDPEATAEAHLKEAVLELPRGLAINPSAANGLGGCSPSEVDLTAHGPASCPDASKLGTASVFSPALGSTLSGAVYLAEPFENPFDSLLALYVAISDPETGVVVKLAGRVVADPATGQLTATFPDLPQLPFEEIKIHFFDDSLTTPACGAYSSRSSLTPWSAPASGAPATPDDSWSISRDCANPESGGDRASLEAGAAAPEAAAYSPFSFSLVRDSASAEFERVSVTGPLGLTANLRNVAICPESALRAISTDIGGAEQELEHPSCPQQARVGTATIKAGSGPRPLLLAGNVFLAGPYSGAPLSLAVIVPARAGPLDLGAVLERIAVDIDPTTAQLHLSSDPFPTILAGIPIDIRELRVSLDRRGFTRNPTSCDQMAILGDVEAINGARSRLSSRFQVGGCRKLGFRPRFKVRFGAAAARNGHPSIEVVIRPRSGDSNIASASLSLPSGELLDPSHLADVCAREDFASQSCPPDSLYGKARAWSPLLEKSLNGDLYLREGPGKYPDLALHFGGRFDLDLIGRLETPPGRVRAIFGSLPDLPISRLRLDLPGGSHGLLINTNNLCRRSLSATIAVSSHNRLRRRLDAATSATCGTDGRRALASGGRLR